MKTDYDIILGAMFAEAGIAYKALDNGGDNVLPADVKEEKQKAVAALRSYMKALGKLV